MSKKLDFPATARNANAILAILQQYMAFGDVFEIASGSGQHVVHFAKALRQNTFWPSDPEPDHIASIIAWSEQASLCNIMPPQRLDVTDHNWYNGDPIEGLPESFSAILCSNMIHIAPITAAKGMFAGAGKRLQDDGQLFLYGPFFGISDNEAPSNIEFDKNLKQRNPEWGVRSIDKVKAWADSCGLYLGKTISMPANNFVLIFHKNNTDS